MSIDVRVVQVSFAVYVDQKSIVFIGYVFNQLCSINQSLIRDPVNQLILILMSFNQIDQCSGSLLLVFSVNQVHFAVYINKVLFS